MKPVDVATAARLLVKREALLRARKSRGPDYAYRLQSTYKTAGFADVCFIDDHEVGLVVDVLLEGVDAELTNLGVEIL